MLFSLLLGGITHHYIGSSLPYCNTINDYGTIQHGYVAAMAGNADVQIGVLAGKDSACGDIVGPIASVSISKNLSAVVGGYNTNFKEFYDRGIAPPNIDGVTPIAGLSYAIPITDNVSFDTTVSIGIITHAIKITWR